jgi:mRNA interferase MazF
VQRGELWWASLPKPLASEPGHRRPVLIVQSDDFNRSVISTVVVAAVTANVRLAGSPGNVALNRQQSGLPRDSVVNVSQILTVDRSFLTERVARLPVAKMREVDSGLARVLDLGDGAGIR